MKKIDRSNWMKWLVLILASFIVLPTNATNYRCPDGEHVIGQNPESTSRCDSSLDMYVLQSAIICCQLSSAYQCKQTGMVARFIQAGNVFNGHVDLTLSKSLAVWKDFVYVSTRNEVQILCPHPIGYLWFTQFPTPSGELPRHFLPTDREDDFTTLKPCNKNGDCAVDAFCGDVINRSFEGKYSRLKSQALHYCTLGGFTKASCDLYPADQPYVDEHRHFCYKVPDEVGATTDNAQAWIESNEMNLKLCDRDETCGKGRKCVVSQVNRWSAYNRKTKKREEHQGICIESVPISYTFFKIYEALPTANKQTNDGKKYLPANSEIKKRSQLEPCKKNWDCVDKEFCGYVYSWNDVASMDSINKYCYKVPEDLPNAFVKPDGVDLLVCNGDQDCDGGTCDTAASRNYLSKVNSQQKVFTGICSKPPAEEEDSSLIIILVVILVALIVVVFATLIGGFVLFKLKKKPTNCATETTGDGKKKKKAKKEKKNKKGKKGSGKTSTTTKSLSVTGKSGMGTTTGGYSPAIF